MERWELTPIFDARKSFYGKAIVERSAGGHESLYSYNTLVAEFEPGLFGPDQYKVHGTYSATTKRHIVEFMRQKGVNPWTLDVGRVVNLTGADVVENYQGALV